MKIIIMRGIPGSGKTTYIKNNFPDATVCSADPYFTVHGVYQFDAMELPMAHAWCLRTFVTEVLSGRSNRTVVVDNTNISVAELAPYAALAQAYSHDVEIITLDVMPQTGITRNIHGVPPAAIAQMWCDLQNESLHIPGRWPHRRIKDE